MTDLTEAEAADISLLALVRAFEARGRVTAGISETHLTKAVFKLADEFDLPITRCWFKFGQYVQGPFVSTGRLAEIRASGAGALAVRIATDLRSDFAKLKDRAIALVPFFTQPLDQFLPDYYREEAPDPYRDIYSTNFDMVSFLRRLPGEQDLRSRQTHYRENATPLITKFQRATARIVRDEEARALLLDYTGLLEELVIRYDRADATLDLDAWRRFFWRAADGYLDQVWTLPAAQIAAETMVGPRSDEVSASMLKTAALAPRYRDEVYAPLRSEAEAKDYLPSEDDLRPLVAGAKQRTATRAEAIEELSHLARQGD